MLLKYLDIQGFKSFPDKTRVAFGKGLTAVVGPNGSGKSNISDAVRWVLGEQSTKTLRGEKMEDVIFSGTKTRKQQGFAEVSLTFDNADRMLQLDMDEVTITRRYDRNGESEYMLNRSPVRLKDIQELLMDTGLGKDGYSLIGQGKIAEIIQSKSGERREIFDEAAGISKFRYHKAEAERNLAKAEDNLIRLRDIMTELEARLGPLKEQSQKAQKFLELSGQKKSLEVSLWMDTIEKSNQLLKDQGDRLLVAQEKREAIEKQIADIEEGIQSTFEAMQKKLAQTDLIRRQKSNIETEISNMTAQIAVFENDITHHEQDIARLSDTIQMHSQSTENTLAAIDQKEREQRDAEEALNALQSEIQEKQSRFEQKLNESEGMSRQEKELSDEVNGLLLVESQAKMALASLEMNISELSETIAKNGEAKKQREEEQNQYSKELAEADAFMAELCEKAESLRNAYSGYKMKYDSRMQKLNEIKNECEKTSLFIKEQQQRVHLLQNMEQSMEGFAFSVREVMKRAKSNALRGVLGTVSQLLSVEGEYSTAIETAIGGSLQNIIVEDEGSAKAAIRQLKQDNLGRATFLPLTSVKGSVLRETGLEQYAGFIDLAVNLAVFDEKYRSVMNSLLGRIAVVDDIDTAVLIAQKYGYKFKLVTLDGQVVNAGGSLTGGSKNKSQGFLSRKNDIERLKREITTKEEDLSRQKSAMVQMQAEVNRIEAEYTAVSAEMTTVNEDRIRAEGEQKRLSQLFEQGAALLSSMEKELEDKSGALSLLYENKEKNSLELHKAQERINELTGKLQLLQAENRTSAEEKTLMSEEINALKLTEITRRKDIEAIQTAIVGLHENRSQADDQLLKLKAELEAYHLGIEEIQTRIGEIQESIAGKKQQLADMDAEIQKAMEERQQLEGKTTLLRKDARAAQEEKEKLSSELVRLEDRKLQIQTEYDELIMKLWDEYELTRSEAEKIARSLENPQKESSELISLRNKIRNLGSVNVAAIEEYKEVGERYEYLSGQMKDAEQSKQELLRLIGELTQRMQTIFSENFEKINAQFKQIFVELFGGGKAELRLSDPDNLLETGIDILVEPPGKIINNLASLSGGEQALVAIAIYFSILKVHPAPFCFLDEIEAALDDVNVDKFAVYLKGMSGKTQFIAITHRRGTMEAADILYGVTMQDEGVSKLLQLKVSEIEETLHSVTKK